MNPGINNSIGELREHVANRIKRKKAGGTHIVVILLSQQSARESIAVQWSDHLWESRDYIIAKYSAHDAIIITLKMHNSIYIRWASPLLVAGCPQGIAHCIAKCHVSHTAGERKHAALCDSDAVPIRMSPGGLPDRVRE